MRPLTLKILVVDDHALMRKSVRAILETDDGFEVVGEAETAAAAVEQAGALRPDVVLLDLRLPDADGFACLDALARRVPEAAVIVFSAMDEPELVSAALDRGAAGVQIEIGTQDPEFDAERVRQLRQGVPDGAWFEVSACGRYDFSTAAWQ